MVVRFFLRSACWSPLVASAVLRLSSFPWLPYFWMPVGLSKRRSIGRWFPLQPIKLLLYLFHENAISVYIHLPANSFDSDAVSWYPRCRPCACVIYRKANAVLEQECLNAFFPAGRAWDRRVSWFSTTDKSHNLPWSAWNLISPCMGAPILMRTRGCRNYHYGSIITCDLAERSVSPGADKVVVDMFWGGTQYKCFVCHQIGRCYGLSSKWRHECKGLLFSTILLLSWLLSLVLCGITIGIYRRIGAQWYNCVLFRWQLLLLVPCFAILGDYDIVSYIEPNNYRSLTFFSHHAFPSTH